ncbi:HK97-gp10 family putative phage morphogenesis protein [Fictibacillus aquaticus]|uniref:HK97 gp10 family phage protein n=1 Tax=Fictibacillus aquaticus TaxID=2021314 RepID=A0A235F9E0_9BACL|nr:HK97-gp10 family putative phage morphogenesis protein [Fictibacillus aquaticus]OYD57872.1 hypothetical protein CGZ90_08190 [Fictibacillus aquaticus]
MARLDFEGFDELEKFFDEVGKDVEKTDKVALKAGGEIIAEAQRELVNRSGKDQDHIQDNIRVSGPTESSDGEKFVSIGPNKKVAWRAHFLEYGTVNMPAYPFIEKGADVAGDRATEKMAEIYMEAIKE